MKMLRIVRKPVAAVLALSMFLCAAPIIPVQAALVGTDQVLQSAQTARDKVNAFMAREDVKAELRELGIEPAEAQARVKALSDREVLQIAGKIDSMPAGEGIGAVIGAAVLIFVILLITDLVGLTHVFGFTNKGSLNPNR